MVPVRARQFARRLNLSVVVLFAGFILTLYPSPAVGAESATTGNGGKKTPAPSDLIVFTNGDQLSGKFLREVAGTVTFHSDILGDVNVKWDKIKELHTASKLAVLDKSVPTRRKQIPTSIPVGTLSVADGMITIHADDNGTISPVPVKNAQYILDQMTLERQVRREPNWLAGWNGSATGGATVVRATQSQYTLNGAISLVRTVPTVSWLDAHNRTTFDFSGSYGKITQPAFVSGGVFNPATTTKSAIYHADAERDEYFTPRFYVLGQTAFDHNFAQGLDLQQIYGGGIGWTAIKRPTQQLDVKGTVQYEKQEFISSTVGTNQNLIGSTFASSYFLKLPRNIILKQDVSYIPAYNNTNAYSANESNSMVIPFYKNLSFSIGTTDSYLNDPPPSTPPTKQNSFQFTFGATYLFKSKY